MLPILPFVAGVVVGASALRVYRAAKASPRLEKAVENASRKIHAAAISGLEGIQETSARWQTRLATQKPPEPESSSPQDNPIPQDSAVREDSAAPQDSAVRQDRQDRDQDKKDGA
jgi:hypothetical protein